MQQATIPTRTRLACTNASQQACMHGGLKANTSSIQTSWVVSHLFQLTFLWVFAYIYMTIAGRLTAPLVVGTARCSSYHRLDSHIAEHAIKPEVRCWRHRQRQLRYTINGLLRAGPAVSEHIIDKYHSSPSSTGSLELARLTSRQGLDLLSSLVVAALDIVNVATIENNGTNIMMDQLSRFDNCFYYVILCSCFLLSWHPT